MVHVNVLYRVNNQREITVCSVSHKTASEYRFVRAMQGEADIFPCNQYVGSDVF